MGVKLRHVEQLVQVAVAKPLTWTLYVCGVILVILALRQIREANKMTQAELGEKCGLHRTFIGSVERGERNVSILNLRGIARVLRVSLTQLVDG